MYRNTYALIDTKKIYENAKYLTSTYNNYKYYFGVVKYNEYGHGYDIINALIKGGINYLAVATLDEALEIRKNYPKIPILVLEPIDLEFIDKAVFYDITITVDSLKYLKDLMNISLDKRLTVHFKVDSGMNRLGFKTCEEFTNAYSLIANSEQLYLEGIYTHFATSGINDKYYDYQVNCFESITKNVNLNVVKIIHADRSITLANKNKLDYCNGCRFGMLLYGISGRKIALSFMQKIKNKIKNILGRSTNYPKVLPLNPSFELYTEVMSIRKANKGECIGYGTYWLEEDAKVATLPIGYADGVDKSFKYVYISGQKYPIVADTMDMIMILVNDKVKIKDKVEIIGKNISILDVCKNTGLNAYHLFTRISNRVTRKYK